MDGDVIDGNHDALFVVSGIVTAVFEGFVAGVVDVDLRDGEAEGMG